MAEKNTSPSAVKTAEGHGLRHIAFIMDGNGRWAKKRGLPRSAGHVAGAKKFREIINYCGDIGIECVTVYAFSTENWSRPEDEVRSIMKLFRDYLRECESTADKYDIRMRFLGDISCLGEELERRANALVERTKNNRLQLNIALNYGGRAEIVRAFNRLAEEGKTNITEADISGALYCRTARPGSYSSHGRGNETVEFSSLAVCVRGILCDRCAVAGYDAARR